MKIRVAGITHESIVDGPGLRTVIWGQGCPHACPGCHNDHTQPAEGGEEVELTAIYQQLDDSFLAQGVTLSGGEPFMQPEAFAQIAQYAKQKGMDVWCYTGYTWDRLLEMAKAQPAIGELLKAIDVLVEGPFIIAEKNLNLMFRGSGNQQIIDVARSLKFKAPIGIPDAYFRADQIVVSF